MGGIIIYRSHHAQQYVVVPNYIARDGRLSFRARGLLVMLLSLPPSWHVTTDQLAEHAPEGRDPVRRAMAELRRAGYVRVVREQDGRGRWHTTLEVYDVPQPDATRPASGATSDDGMSSQVTPDAGQPAAGQPAPKYFKYGVARARAPRASPEFRPAWCGQCDEDTRLTDEDAPRRCPACHPLAAS